MKGKIVKGFRTGGMAAAVEAEVAAASRRHLRRTVHYRRSPASMEWC